LGEIQLISSVNGEMHTHSWVKLHTPIIPTTLEAEIRRIEASAGAKKKKKKERPSQQTS
jgi:hypothetical protein